MGTHYMYMMTTVHKPNNLVSIFDIDIYILVHIFYRYDCLMLMHVVIAILWSTSYSKKSLKDKYIENT